MKNFLTKTQRTELLEEHKLERDKHFADRIKTILLLDSGWSYEQIAGVLFLDDSTIRRYEKNYISGGIEGLLTDNYKGGFSLLTSMQEEELKKHLSEKTYLSCKEIMSYIEKKYNIVYKIGGVLHLLKRLGFAYKKPKQVPSKADTQAQENFVQEYMKIIENKGEKDRIYFIDGTHPHHNAIPTYGWILKGTDKELLTNTGRERININGAIDTETMDFEMNISESINAQSTITLFKALEAKNPDAAVIHIIADNARYYRANMVTEFLKTSKIKVHFLPAYSPNLNLIERFWKFFKKKVLYNKYYETYDNFNRAILDFFGNIKDYTDELKSLLTNNFHIVS